MGQPSAHFLLQGGWACPSSLGPNVLFPSPNRTSGASALLTGKGATLGPKSSARPDEPGPGDSAGLGEHLEKYPASHLPCVVTLPVRAAWGRRGKGRIAAPSGGNQALGPGAASPRLLPGDGYVTGPLVPRTSVRRAPAVRRVSVLRQALLQSLGIPREQTQHPCIRELTFWRENEFPW